MIYLLDVNVLVGMLDPRHTFHSPAHQWFDTEIGPSDGWATCPITENGCLRVGSTVKYAGKTTLPFDSLMAALNKACHMPNHRFWSLDRSIRSFLPPGVILSPKQITDVYLLGSAVANQGKFATFDQSVPAQLLPGGVDALEVIPVPTHPVP